MLGFINRFSVLNHALHFELKAMLDAINLNLEKQKQRRQLLRLEDHLLNDIGVTRQQVLVEAKANKKFNAACHLS